MTRQPAAFTGTSSEAIKQIFGMFPRVKTVLDPTFGKGVFYRECPQLEILAGDIIFGLGVVQLDCRALPFADKTFDAVVIDLPFHQGGSGSMYQESYSVHGKGLKALLQDYVAAVNEGLRVARVLVAVKCADAVESGRFVPFAAQLIGSIEKPLWDIVITVRSSSPAHPSWKTVQHFRHNYAYYLIWEAK